MHPLEPRPRIPIPIRCQLIRIHPEQPRQFQLRQLYDTHDLDVGVDGAAFAEAETEALKAHFALEAKEGAEEGVWTRWVLVEVGMLMLRRMLVLMLGWMWVLVLCCGGRWLALSDSGYVGGEVLGQWRGVRWRIVDLAVGMGKRERSLRKLWSLGGLRELGEGHRARSSRRRRGIGENIGLAHGVVYLLL